MKTKIELTKKESEWVEIDLPHFRTDGICHIYKVFSKDLCVQVCYTDKGTIGVHHAGLAWNWASSMECTEAEFIKIYNEVNERINYFAFPDCEYCEDGKVNVSSCCGAEPKCNGDSDTSDIGICPDCGDHCEYGVECEECDGKGYTKIK